ncbi:MAG TPA: IclR family transcriptional regulator [Tissierellia bacterium]|nr:IclR family transcriptional regulator [Tissierellia bacterium]
MQSVDRAIQILKLFSEDRKEMKLTEIANELDLNKSTVYGILSTLKYHGLIDQDEKTQKYRLGLYLMRLGNLVANSIDVINIAHPIIEEVSHRLNETVHLSKLDRLEIVYLDKVESNQSIRISTAIGTRKLAYCTGMGKVLLAFSDLNEVEKSLPDKLQAFTPNTVIDKKVLLEELRNIKKIGYAIDREESEIGLMCIAAPIFDYNGEVKYALSVSGPTPRITEERLEKIINIAKDTARKISYKLGY